MRPNKVVAVAAAGSNSRLAVVQLAAYCLIATAAAVGFLGCQCQQQDASNQQQQQQVPLFDQSKQQHLAQYNQLGSSSALGEPIFRLEPPNVIYFANNLGTTIPCLASGVPRVSISWFAIGGNSLASSNLSLASGQYGLSDELKLVGNVTNLRQLLQNNQALRLLPFKEADFRPEIHATEYRCVASNPLGTIHSRSVVVQAGELF